MRTAVGNFTIVSEGGSRRGIVNQLDFHGASVSVSGATATVEIAEDEDSATELEELADRVAALEAGLVALQAQVDAIVVSNVTSGSNWRYVGATNTFQITDGSGSWYTPSYFDGGITLTPA